MYRQLAEELAEWSSAEAGRAPLGRPGAPSGGRSAARGDPISALRAYLENSALAEYDVAAEQATNKMSERAIAIVLAPNLYESPDAAEGANPLEGLMRTQKMTKFLSELLFHYIKVRVRVRGPGGAADDAGAAPATES